MTPREPGQTASRTRTVRERDIELFSELTGDCNPLHYDGSALVWTEAV
jgi:acyl dehydratase